MATASEGVIETLSELAESIKGSEEGYRAAAGGTRDPAAKTMFERYAEQRREMAEELTRCIRGLGAEPPPGGALSGRADRVWTSLKSTVPGDDTLAMLEKCERGEDVTKCELQEALQANLPVTLRPTLEMMYGRVREAHDQVRALRDKRRASH